MWQRMVMISAAERQAAATQRSLTNRLNTIRVCIVTDCLNLSVHTPPTGVITLAGGSIMRTGNWT
jgi:hypothetical protein